MRYARNNVDWPSIGPPRFPISDIGPTQIDGANVIFLKKSRHRDMPTFRGLKGSDSASGGRAIRNWIDLGLVFCVCGMPLLLV